MNKNLLYMIGCLLLTGVIWFLPILAIVNPILRDVPLDFTVDGVIMIVLFFLASSFPLVAAIDYYKDYQNEKNNKMGMEKVE